MANDVDLDEFEQELDEMLEQTIQEKRDVLVDVPVKPIDLTPPDISIADVREMHLFVEEDCEPCDTATNRLSEFIKEGNIEVQNITTSEKSLKLTGKWNVDRVPMLVIETDEGVERV